MSKPFFILLVQAIAHKKERGIVSKSKSEDIPVLAGSLFQEVKKSSSSGRVHLISLDTENTELKADPTTIRRLTREECDLLLSVTTCGERIRVLNDKEWLEQGRTLTVDKHVEICNFKGLPDKVLGLIRYKGPLPSLKGTHFGVELLEFRGKGTTDGVFRRERFFTCTLDCGVFVPISKIRSCKERRAYNPDGGSTGMEIRHTTLPKPDLQLEEKVVWISDQGPEFGTVKWIGILQDSPVNRQEYTVGVEFDNAIGTGTGKYKDRQLFRAKQNHASLVPLIGLIKESEFNTSGVQSYNMGYQAQYQRQPQPLSQRRSVVMHPTDTAKTQDDIIREQRNEFERFSKSKRITDNLNIPPRQGDYNMYDGNKQSNVQPDIVVTDSVQRHHQLEDNLNQEVKYPPNHSYTVQDLASRRTPSPHSSRYPPSSQKYRKSTVPAKLTMIEIITITASKIYERWKILAQELGIDETSKSNLITKYPGDVKKQCTNMLLKWTTRDTAVNGEPHTIQKLIRSLRNMGEDDIVSQIERIKETEKKRIEGSGNYSGGDVLEVGSLVEVMGHPPMYGVIRWIGSLPHSKDKNKPIAGIEMEEETKAGTDGSFGKFRLFQCAPKKAFFCYLNKCRRDARFSPSSEEQTFGSQESPEIDGDISPPSSITDVRILCGPRKGIQGHHNSCYLDASLFSMFAFSLAFDSLLHRPRRPDDLPEYEDVQKVLKESIVNPLRKNNFVRADKVMKIRELLDKLGTVKGMMSEEKDPEEFLQSLLANILKADPFIRLSSGQESYLYQLFMEKDERLVMPTTQQLFELSFLQSDIKLAEVPSCLILQMPRFGKDYKMYRRIVPSLYLDITDVLSHAPRECAVCGDLASYECKDCYKHFGESLSCIALCEPCCQKSHRNIKRQNHKPKKIFVPDGYHEFVASQKNDGHDVTIEREILELFAVVCIQTSHYISFVKCGTGENKPWVFFDSMADRRGGENGYNIPEISPCEDLENWFTEEEQKHILTIPEDRALPEHPRRLLCDSYICFYQSSSSLLFK